MPHTPKTIIREVAASTSSQELISLDVGRVGTLLYNDSSSACFVRLGTTAASSTNFSFKMLAGDLYEVPYRHTGPVHVIWTTATGQMRITEIF